MMEIAAAPTADIIDITPQNFMSEVIETSRNKGVIVQFWAPWCGPCKQLGPILEKIVAEQPDLRLARVNIDDNPEIAAQLRVQSVPTVYGIADGRPVDAFTGAQPESTVRQFIEKVVAAAPGAPDITDLLEVGRTALDENDGAAALTAFQEALATIPESADAMSGFVRALVTSGECEQAREVLDSLEDDFLLRPEMREAIAAVEIAEQAGAHSGETASLQAAVEADPDNLQARQDLALALFADGSAREAMDMLLTSLQRDPEWNEGAAKTQLLAFFEALGAPHPDVIKARRKLSTYLFS